MKWSKRGKLVDPLPVVNQINFRRTLIFLLVINLTSKDYDFSRFLTFINRVFIIGCTSTTLIRQTAFFASIARWFL